MAGSNIEFHYSRLARRKRMIRGLNERWQKLEMAEVTEFWEVAPVMSVCEARLSLQISHRIHSGFPCWLPRFRFHFLDHHRYSSLSENSFSFWRTSGSSALSSQLWKLSPLWLVFRQAKLTEIGSDDLQHWRKICHMPGLVWHRNTKYILQIYNCYIIFRNLLRHISASGGPEK